MDDDEEEMDWVDYILAAVALLIAGVVLVLVVLLIWGFVLAAVEEPLGALVLFSVVAVPVCLVLALAAVLREVDKRKWW